MVRYILLIMVVGSVPVWAQKAADPGPMQAFSICLAEAATKLDTHTADPSVVAGKIAESCKKEWAASSPSEQGLSGTGLAEFKAKADQAKHDLALEAVLEERAAGARKTSPRPK